MRLRRIEMDFGRGRVVVDCKGEGGFPLPLIGVSGGNGSGKTLLLVAAMRMFAAGTVERNEIRLFDKHVNGSIEYEAAGSIHVGVIREGVVTQKATAGVRMIADTKRVVDGCLLYDTMVCTTGMTLGTSFARNSMSIILQDFYLREIKNSIVMIDNYDMGLDDVNLKSYTSQLIRKTLERDNQLIVTSVNRSRLSMIPQTGIRTLGDGVDMIDEVIRDVRVRG